MSPEEFAQGQRINDIQKQLQKANEALQKKIREIDTRIADEQPQLFEDCSKLFQVDITPDQRKGILEPYKAEITKLEGLLVKAKNSQINPTGTLF